jgi:hypothetical protein
MLAVTQPPSATGPEPPDAFVALNLKVRLENVKLLRGFVLVFCVKVVKSVVVLSKSLQLKEFKARWWIVFAAGPVWTRGRFSAWTKRG